MNQPRPYTEIVDTLVQSAVKYEMARREHERATLGVLVARGTARPDASSAWHNAQDLEIAIAMERRRRDERRIPHTRRRRRSSQRRWSRAVTRWQP
jgi:hypothetical protein